VALRNHSRLQPQPPHTPPDIRGRCRTPPPWPSAAPSPDLEKEREQVRLRQRERHTDRASPCCPPQPPYCPPRHHHTATASPASNDASRRSPPSTLTSSSSKRTAPPWGVRRRAVGRQGCGPPRLVGTAAPFLAPPPLLTYSVRGEWRGRRGAARVAGRGRLAAVRGGTRRGEGGRKGGGAG
jgi:hypothetical protein